jgi:aspartyl-tRNA(Asn)/glutamyl-tRNA(Gln) amidotransferase subunit B
MFCGCGTGFGLPPNTNICPGCLGFPGALPVTNAEAVKLAAMAGMMLNCDIRLFSKFDRKNYFYPDVAKNYQVSQLDQPICLNGHVAFEVNGEKKIINLNRIHIEEDVGKSTHHAKNSGVDFNRCGIALMEIVTEPELHSPAETMGFLLALKELLVYAGVSDCNLEEGNLRCDVNVSVSDNDTLGTKVEIKNMNTFKGVVAALEYEIERQINVCESGGKIRQETRRWDADLGETFAMRSKENAADYRYFPEPDLPPIILTREQIEAWRALLPESPAARRERLVAEYGITPYDAGVLVAERDVADYFETVAKSCGSGKIAANWVMGDVLKLVNERNRPLRDAALTPDILASLIKLVLDGTISGSVAKELLEELFDNGGDPAALVASRGLAQVRDTGLLEKLVAEVLAENPKVVADFKAGKKASAGFLVGQVMKRSGGKADPKMVSAMIEKALA